MTRCFILVAVLLTTQAAGQEPASPPAKPPASAESPALPVTPETSDYTDLGAAQAVREGNRLLRSNDPAGAMKAYEHARSLEPGAPEIDFAEGLAHYAMGDYEQARASFENAATAKDEALVDDAIYSIGTTYHAEALKQTENPQEAIANLEQAMQRYQTVLDNRPDHAAAGDANFKAASMWRTLKQQMQEQQQQQQQQDENDEQNEDQESQDQQQQSDQQQEQDEQQQSQNQDQESDQQQQQDQQQQDQQQQDQQQSAQDQQQQEQQEQQEQQAQQAKEDSREDAERKLRELMQALRDREKRKPQRVERVRVAPADKDW